MWKDFHLTSLLYQSLVMFKFRISLFSAVVLACTLCACSSSKTEPAAATNETLNTVQSAAAYSTTDEAMHYFNNRDFQGCVDYTTQVMDSEGPSVELLTIRGVAEAKLGYTYISFKDLIAAVQMDYSVTTLLNLGNAYRMFGYCVRAVDAYQQALTLDPDNPMVLMNLTSAYACYDNREAAYQTFEKVVPNFPKDAIGYVNAATLKAMDGDLVQARTAAEKAISIEAYRPAYKMLKFICEHTGDTQCAKQAEITYNQLKLKTKGKPRQ